MYPLLLILLLSSLSCLAENFTVYWRDLYADCMDGKRCSPVPFGNVSSCELSPIAEGRWQFDWVRTYDNPARTTRRFGHCSENCSTPMNMLIPVDFLKVDNPSYPFLAHQTKFSQDIPIFVSGNSCVVYLSMEHPFRLNHISRINTLWDTRPMSYFLDGYCDYYINHPQDLWPHTTCGPTASPVIPTTSPSVPPSMSPTLFNGLKPSHAGETVRYNKLLLILAVCLILYMCM